MSNIILLAETGSDVTPEMAACYGIELVPMHVAFGDDSRDDGTFPIEDIYRYYESTGKLTKTSGCTVGDFEAAFDRLQSQYPGKPILHLAYSAVTTCSYQSAVIAAGGRAGIASVDTKVVSAGQALVVLLMARWLEANPDATLEEAAAQAEQISSSARMGFFPGDLAYLRAGGRVSNAAYLVANFLSLNPLIELLDGHLKATKKYRGKMEKVAPKFLREYVQEQHLTRDTMAFVYSVGLADSIREECTAIARELGFREILWVPTGGVVTTHCGPGGFGVCGIAE